MPLAPASRIRHHGHDQGGSGQRAGSAHVCSWDELDDSVDANDYFRRVRLPAGTSEAAGLREAVNDEIGRRLGRSQGGP
jgi:hypothetical protein